MSREEVINTFPLPEYFEDEEVRKSDKIWVYGNIELYFEDDRLEMIFTDYVGEIDGGPQLDIDKWIFEDGCIPNIDEVVNLFLDERIEFSTKFNFKDQVTIEVSNSLVSLDFSNDNEMKEYRCQAIYKKDVSQQGS